ncbi:MAG: hypothetical protein Q9185_003115 [Variospora sp. 1 TL-2023]
MPLKHTQQQQSKKKKTKKKKQQPFPFLSLPTEVRLIIYHLALTYDHILIRKARARGAASLLLTNRLIHAEASTVFYDANVFQVPLGGLPSDTTAATLANVRRMRQCCLRLKMTPRTESGTLDKQIGKFVAGIERSRKMECLLIDASWPEADAWRWGIDLLQAFKWLRGIHLAQVLIHTVRRNEQVSHWRDEWTQWIERCMMAEKGVSHEQVSLSHGYWQKPRLGIDLVGDELEEAKRLGGWVLQDNDLYALFGKFSVDY